MLKRLNEVNEKPVFSVSDQTFTTYGRIVKGYDFSALIDYMETETDIPDAGNIYVASDQEMEKSPVCSLVQNNVYGGMDIEIGYCNGRNSTLNGMEYHKGSEILIAVTDLMLILGHVWDIKDNQYDGNDTEVFFVEKGTAIELYATTLHLSPCKISDEGFKSIIILPNGTNTPLTLSGEKVETGDALLLMKNKWILAHKERKALIEKGAYPGILGENFELFY